MTDIIISTAYISNNEKHRYSLLRVWDDAKPKVLFIGLNPSRADGVYNDPTIRRCIVFAQDWGFGGMYFGNLYSFRTPYPKTLIDNLSEAYNNETDEMLKGMMTESDKVVCAWGSWHFINDRAKQVLAMIPEPYCFGLNRDDNPKHPLYLKRSAQLSKFIWQ